MGIGLGEFIIILLVVFVVVGPEDLPKIARTLARWVKAVRGTMKDISSSFEKELGQDGITDMDVQMQADLHQAGSEFEKIQKQVLEAARKEGAS